MSLSYVAVSPLRPYVMLVAVHSHEANLCIVPDSVESGCICAVCKVVPPPSKDWYEDFPCPFWSGGYYPVPASYFPDAVFRFVRGELPCDFTSFSRGELPDKVEPKEVKSFAGIDDPGLLLTELQPE